MTQAKAPIIKSVTVRPLGKTGSNLKAFASVQIGPLTIHGFRIIQQDGQRAYVAPPQVEYNSNGTRKFKPMVAYPDSWKDAITEAVLSQWDADLKSAADAVDIGGNHGQYFPDDDCMRTA